MEPKRLYRSRDQRMISGVCGGLAEYINLDPTIIRLLWVIFGITGVGVLAYIIALIVVPEQ